MLRIRRLRDHQHQTIILTIPKNSNRLNPFCHDKNGDFLVLFTIFEYLYPSRMITVTKQVNLRPLHTFGMNVYASCYAEATSVHDLLQLSRHEDYAHVPWFILGGGSNVLFTSDITMPVVNIAIPGVTIVREDGDKVWVRAGAGVSWHELVVWSLRQGLCGLENLSLIPGRCGAAPMQNIGAYGVELADCFDSLEAIHRNSLHVHTFDLLDCAFGYRTSAFKTTLRNQYIITSITLRLSRSSTSLNLDYGDIRAVLKEHGISSPGPRDVSEAVIKIRKSKLPDPAVIGNAGSFFKNPEVSQEKATSMRQLHPGIPAYPLANGNVKLAAGWLIDQLGLKGYRSGDAGIHEKQALVLVNHGEARGDEVLEIARMVQSRVEEAYGVELEPEVNILP